MFRINRFVNKAPSTVFEQFARANSSSAKAKNYAVERGNYRNQLTELRKAWSADFLRKKDIRDQQLKEAQRLMVENKAIRLRERRAVTAINVAEHMKWQDSDQLRKRLYQAKQTVIFNQKVAKQNERFKQVARDLTEESATWISYDNIQSKITADLFAKDASTTGIVTKYSEHWRYQTESYRYTYERAFRPEQFAEPTKSPEELQADRRAERKSRFRQDMHTYLSAMAGTGEERTKLKDLVDEMVEKDDRWKDVYKMVDRAQEMSHDIVRFESASGDDLTVDFNTPNEKNSTPLSALSDANADRQFSRLSRKYGDFRVPSVPMDYGQEEEDDSDVEIDRTAPYIGVAELAELNGHDDDTTDDSDDGDDDSSNSDSSDDSSDGSSGSSNSGSDSDSDLQTGSESDSNDEYVDESTDEESGVSQRGDFGQQLMQRGYFTPSESAILEKEKWNAALAAGKNSIKVRGVVHVFTDAERAHFQQRQLKREERAFSKDFAAFSQVLDLELESAHEMLAEAKATSNQDEIEFFTSAIADGENEVQVVAQLRTQYDQLIEARGEATEQEEIDQVNSVLQEVRKAVQSTIELHVATFDYDSEEEGEFSDLEETRDEKKKR